MAKKDDLRSKMFGWMKHLKHHAEDVESLRPEEEESVAPKDPTLGQRNRKRGDKNEDIAARVTGINKTAGSGCGLIEKGDLADKHILVEAKSTDQEIMRIELRWWEKAKRQASEKGKLFHLLQIAFMNRKVPVNTMPFVRWLIIPQYLFWDSYIATDPPKLDTKHPTWAWNQHDGRDEPFLILFGRDAAVVFPEHWFTSEIKAQVIREAQ